MIGLLKSIFMPGHTRVSHVADSKMLIAQHLERKRDENLASILADADNVMAEARVVIAALEAEVNATRKRK